MSNPVPLSEQKINEIISNCDHEIQETMTHIYLCTTVMK